ncbi:YjbE family putative metal transport protein [Aurantimonas sp. VKM B-3413]|uniref:YjbE family putative metal transport protein n=1 Tax=Aurantimonas sp. VKM B-3413 TaxID=2779401 RepID=UPI001E425EFE|nr:YjbE family putative metal transport protein [Aurantimonas sp. VKM B-3413]MCB8836990.1 YjbE family putative metal transport protein [Aurantimonas sp. VKM B-3413]
MDALTLHGLMALAQVVFIDLVLAGDNAVVIGLAAAGLPPEQRSKAVLIGIAAATLLRIGFAVVATELLEIVGLLLAGGLLLLWVTWKLWAELREGAGEGALAEGADGAGMPRKNLASAVWTIIVADVSMSLDNVIAVAGAARDHLVVLGLGLVLSVALMGLAATLIARLLARHRWIAYAGLLVILFVALRMIVEGAMEVAPLVG